MRAGLDDVGLGALFGLYDYKYEVGACCWVGLVQRRCCGGGRGGAGQLLVAHS